MRDEPGIAVEAIMHAIGTPTYEGVDAEAKAVVGAAILYELTVNIDALVKGLAAAGK